MTRVEGDPGPLGWLKFAFGFRMPAANVHWVRHELTGPGWRWRVIARHLAVVVPVSVLLVLLLAAFLPVPVWVGVMTVALVVAGSLFTVVFYADDVRAARLRQHGLPVPSDPDLGRPTH